MYENPTRAGVPRSIRILAPPMIILAVAAVAMLSIACSDDKQAESEQPVRQSVAQVEQQQQQQQEAQQQEVQQQAVSYEQEAQEQSYDYQEQQQAEQQEQAAQQQAMQEQEEAEQAASDSSRSRRQQREQRSSEEQRTPRRSLPGSTNFEDYATTGWRETDDDDTSTFSLDVDRTSYFLGPQLGRGGLCNRTGLGSSRRVDQRLQLQLRTARRHGQLRRHH